MNSFVELIRRCFLVLGASLGVLTAVLAGTTLWFIAQILIEQLDRHVNWDSCSAQVVAVTRREVNSPVITQWIDFAQADSPTMCRYRVLHVAGSAAFAPQFKPGSQWRLFISKDGHAEVDTFLSAEGFLTVAALVGLFLLSVLGSVFFYRRCKELVEAGRLLAS